MLDTAINSALRKCRETLTNDLTVDDILDKLASREVISESDEAEIELEKTDKTKVRKLINLLKKKTDSEFQTFIKILREDQGLKHIADKLESEITKINAAISDNSDSSNNIRLDLRSKGIPDPPNNQINRNESVKAIRKELKLMGRNSGWVLVYGEGGIGKSVLASVALEDKELVHDIYNENIIWLVIGPNSSPSEQRTSLTFLHDLLSKLDPNARLTNNLIETRNKIGRYIRENSGGVLIILDDVWDGQIIRDMDLGATVLVTSTFSHILDDKTRSNRISKIHIDKGLTLEESKALFRQANENRLPPDLDQFVENCHKDYNGLPLAMSLISADIESHKRARLKPTMKTLDKIKYVIKISVDALDEDLRHKYHSLVIFKAGTLISCETLSVFWGIDEDYVIDHMDELVSRCLCYAEYDSGMKCYRYGLLQNFVTYLLSAIDSDTLLVEHHRKFLENFKSYCGENWDDHILRDNYIWNELMYHYSEAGWQDKLLDQYQDLKFLVMMMRHLGPDSLINDFKNIKQNDLDDHRKEILKHYRRFLLKNKHLLKSHLPYGPYIPRKRKSIPGGSPLAAVGNNFKDSRNRHGSASSKKRSVSPSGWVKSLNATTNSEPSEPEMLTLIIQLGLCESHKSLVFAAALKLAVKSDQFYWELCNSDIQSFYVKWSTYLPGDCPITLIEAQMEEDKSLLIANAEGDFRCLDVKYGDVLEREWLGQDIFDKKSDDNNAITLQLSHKYIMTAGPGASIRVWFKEDLQRRVNCPDSGMPSPTHEPIKTESEITCCTFNMKDLIFIGMKNGHIGVYNYDNKRGEVSSSYNISGSVDGSSIIAIAEMNGLVLCAEGYQVKIYDDFDMEWRGSHTLNKVPTDVKFCYENEVAYSYGPIIETASYDFKTKSTYRAPSPSNCFIKSFCFSNCYNYVAGASTSGNVVIWDFVSTDILFNFWEHSSPVTSVYFTRIHYKPHKSHTVLGIDASCGPTSHQVSTPLKSGYLVSGSSNGTIFAFSLKQAHIDHAVQEKQDVCDSGVPREQLFRIRLRSRFEAWFGPAAEDTMLIVGQTPNKNKIKFISKCYSQTKPVKYYTNVTPSYAENIEEQSTEALVYAINFRADTVAVAFQSAVIQIFNLKWADLRLTEAHCSQEYKFSNCPSCLAFLNILNEKKTLVAADDEGNFMVFPLGDAHCESICSITKAHNGKIQRVRCLSAKEQTRQISLITVGFTDGRLKLWRVENRESGDDSNLSYRLVCLQEINAHEDNIHDCDVDFSETKLVTGSADKTAKVWDLTNGKMLFHLSNMHTDCVRVCRFCPNRSDCIATGDDQEELRVWKLGITDKISDKLAIDFSRDSCSSEVLKSFCSSHESVRSTTAWLTDLIWSEDGRTLITASDCLRSWRLEEDYSRVQRTLHLRGNKVDRVRGDTRHLVTVDQAGHLYILSQVGLSICDHSLVDDRPAIKSLREDREIRRASVSDAMETASTKSPVSY